MRLGLHEGVAPPLLRSFVPASLSSCGSMPLVDYSDSSDFEPDEPVPSSVCLPRVVAAEQENSTQVCSAIPLMMLSGAQGRGPCGARGEVADWA